MEVDDEEKLGICTNKPSRSQCDEELEVKSGFLACVKSLDSRFLFPFKSSPNIVRSYVFAVPNPKITFTSEKPSTLRVTEGESVRLNCSFTFTRDYDRVPFVVYWIKTVRRNSTCVYSYDSSKRDKDRYGHHCDVQEELKNRLSNQSKEPHSHNISISRVKESDGGQYLCAVQVHPNNKNTARRGNWTVIHTVTVSIDKAKLPQPTETTETQNTSQKTTKETTQITTQNTTQNTVEETTQNTAQNTTQNTAEEKPETDSDGDHLVPLYVAVSIIVCLLLVAVVVFIEKKSITSQGNHTVEKQLGKPKSVLFSSSLLVVCRSQHVHLREEAPNMDCSPYAVGNGDMGNFFGSKAAHPGPEKPAQLIDPYSVVRLNSLYESGVSDHNKRI
ncbi:hypothetical protein NFI96_017672 [Prochilodus magdalenae]|nr:hypothetical protein NFI96_017672 [Prochilodus magdalenae]